MKKILFMVLLICSICVVAAGCSSSKSDAGAQDTRPVIDIDFTLMSDTMASAELTNMFGQPDKYMDKTVKISGPYQSYFYDKTKAYYHYVLFADTSACCQQYVEFQLNGDGYSYPEDYPDNFTNIEIVGVFSAYNELGTDFYYLAIDEFAIL